MSDTITNREIDRLSFQFKTSENLINFLKAFLAESDELYDSEQELLTDRNLDTAVGAQLDGLGQIVGIIRPSGETDDIYRLEIKAKILVNMANMSVDGILELFQFVFGADRVRYYLPANLDPYFVIGGTITEPEEFIFSFFPTTLGVGVTYISVPSIEDSFSFDEDPTGKGWGDATNLLVGGNFVKIIEP